MKLICLPYSGSSSAAFKGWDQLLAPDIEVVKFDYPGRGTRHKEPASHNLNALISGVVQLVVETQGPYALFGHSMGSLVSYLSSLQIQSLGLQRAEHLFLSGFEPPHIYFGRKSQTHRLSDIDFIRRLEMLGNMPRPQGDSARILPLYLQAIRHDFFLLETHDFHQTNLELTSPISVLLGKDDPLTTTNEPHQWYRYSSAGCKLYKFEGNHFFIESGAEEVTATIKRVLNEHENS